MENESTVQHFSLFETVVSLNRLVSRGRVWKGFLMRKTELERYRKRLLALRARIRGDVNSVLQASLDRDGGSTERAPGDEADAGSDNWDTELAINLTRNDSETLDLIESALQRIDDKTYGVCVATGNKIAKARLDALPFTPYCVEYASQLEDGGIRKPR